MESPLIFIPITLILMIAILLITLILRIVDRGSNDEPEIESTRQIPDVDADFDVPEEDQEYLAPMMVNILKHLAAHKRSYPTNAQLINHLAESLGHASSEFKKWTKDDPTVQRGNDLWLDVAAVAIRLYDEGTYHNATSTREQFVTAGVLASREIDQWAMQVNEEVAASVRKKMGVESKGVEDVSAHAQTVGNTPYTADEMEDLKEAHDSKILNFKQRKR